MCWSLNLYVFDGSRLKTDTCRCGTTLPIRLLLPSVSAPVFGPQPSVQSSLTCLLPSARPAPLPPPPPPPSFLPFLVFILALPWFQLFYLLISFSIRSPCPSLCLLLWCLSVQSQLCLPLHILEERGLPQVAVTVGALLNLAPPRHSSTTATPTTPSTPPGPSVTI